MHVFPRMVFLHFIPAGVGTLGFNRAISRSERLPGLFTVISLVLAFILPQALLEYVSK